MYIFLLKNLNKHLNLYTIKYLEYVTVYNSYKAFIFLRNQNQRSKRKKYIPPKMAHHIRKGNFSVSIK